MPGEKGMGIREKEQNEEAEDIRWPTCLLEKNKKVMILLVEWYIG